MATPPKKPTDGTQPPAPRKPATPRQTTRKTAAAPTPKPAARKNATPRATAAKPATARKTAAKRTTTGKAAASAKGRKWGTAAVIGAVGAAVTAGLLALRGSTPSSAAFVPRKGDKAHQADGTDSSASFEAGIADEGTIPS